MKLALILFIGMFVVVQSFAGHRDTSFSELGEQTFVSPLTAEQIRKRLEVRADMYLLDKKGKKILFQHPVWRKWRSREGKEPIESRWSTVSKKHEPLALYHRWGSGKGRKDSCQNSPV